MSSIKVDHNLTCSLSIKIVATGAAGKRAFDPSALVISIETRIVDGSSHSDEDFSTPVQGLTKVMVGIARVATTRSIVDASTCTPHRIRYYSHC